MSEPEVEWYIERMKILLKEIDSLASESIMTNSKREIILFNTNEIEIIFYTIMRKLKENK